MHVDGWLFLSGQIGLDPASGELVPGGVEAETERLLENLRAVLAAAGAGMDDVAKTTIYLVDLADFGQVESIYGWQVFDRILKRVAGSLEGMRGGLLPGDFMLTLDGVAAGRFVLFLLHDSVGGAVTSSYLDVLATSLGNRLQHAVTADGSAACFDTDRPAASHAPSPRPSHGASPAGPPAPPLPEPPFEQRVRETD